MTEKFSPRSYPPNFAIIENHFFTREAIKEFQRKQSATAEIEGLQDELNQVHAIPPDAAGAEAELRQHHAAYAKSRVDILEKALFRDYIGGDPLRFVKNHTLNLALNHVLVPYIGEAEFLAAYRQSAPKGKTITKEKRVKMIAKIEGKISGLQDEIDRLFPAIFKGKNSVDLRSEFVKSWFDVQNRVNSACTSRGFCISYAQEGERLAHKLLSIGDAIKRDGLDVYDPHPNS